MYGWTCAIRPGRRLADGGRSGPTASSKDVCWLNITYKRLACSDAHAHTRTYPIAASHVRTCSYLESLLTHAILVRVACGFNAVRCRKRIPGSGTCRGRSAVAKACDLQCQRPLQGLQKNCTGIFRSTGVA